MVCPAAAAAIGSVSQPSAGMMVAQIDERVRSLVCRNCRASGSNAGSGERRSSRCTSPAAASGSATHAEHVTHRPAAERRGMHQ